MPIRFVMLQPSLAWYRIGVFRELASRPGIDFKLIYAEQPGVRNVDPDGFEAEFVPLKRLKLGSQVLQWYPPHLQYTDGKSADVVCLPWNPYFVSVYPALRRARKHAVGSLVWGHGYSKREKPWRAKIRRSLANRADAAIFYNNTVRDRSVAEGWLPAERAFVALNALDQTGIQAARRAWLADPERLAAFKREHALDAGPVLIFVSRLLPDNRADVLLDAAARLKSDLPTLRTVIVGGGEAESALKNQAHTLGIADRVTFTGPVWGEDQLAPWFLSADLFVYPANIGLSILHALGYGVPVITSDRTETQNPEIESLTDGVNGRLYPHLDADALARTIADTLADRAKLESMSAAALRTATEDFTIARMADGFEQAARYCHEQARKRK